MNSRKVSSARRTLLIGSLCAAVTAVAAAIIYFFAYHNSYDTVIHHYNFDTSLPMIFGILMLICTVAFAITSIRMRSLHLSVSPTGNVAESFGLWLCAFMFVIFFAFCFVQQGTVESVSTASNATKFGTVCSNINSPLALLSALSLFLTLHEKTRGTTLHAVFTFAPVLWSVTLVLKYYFDLADMPLNDPELTLTMVSLSGVVLLFLGECRLALGIASAATVAFSASAALFLTGGITATRIILFRTDALTLPTPAESALLISATILGACRLVSLYSFIGKCSDSDGAKEDDDEFVSPSDNVATDPI